MGGIAFINTSHPNDTRNRKIQKTIRHHVMVDIGRSRRKRRARAPVIPMELLVSPPRTTDEEPETESPGRVVLRAKDVAHEPLWPVNPSGILGIDLDDTTRHILRLLNGLVDYQYRPFMVTWIRMGLSDHSAFYLSMASAVLFWDWQLGVMNKEFHDNPVAGKYYFIALGQLSKRLSDPKECTSPGVIATVLGCLCHDANVDNWSRWSLHVKGLDRIAKLRGGLRGLENNIPLMAFWMDIVGCTVVDERPRFSFPQDVEALSTQDTLPVFSRIFHDIMARHPELGPTLQGLNLMSAIAKNVDCESHSAGYWEDEITAIQIIGPASHHFLTDARLPVMEHVSTQDVHILAERVRLVCLMLLSAIKSRFHLNTSDQLPLRKRLSHLLPLSTRQMDGALFSLYLWTLVTESVLLPRNARYHAISQICDVIQSRGLGRGYKAVLYNTQNQVWISCIEDAEMGRLVEDVDATIRQRK